MIRFFEEYMGSYNPFEDRGCDEQRILRNSLYAVLPKIVKNELPLRLYPLQDIRPSFRPAVFRKHRIQHHRSVVVKGHPVVRKYGIRSMKMFWAVA